MYFGFGLVCVVLWFFALHPDAHLYLKDPSLVRLVLFLFSQIFFLKDDVEELKKKIR